VAANLLLDDKVTVEQNLALGTPFLRESKGGHVQMYYVGRTGLASMASGQQNAIVLTRSADGGHSWSRPGLPSLTIVSAGLGVAYPSVARGTNETHLMQVKFTPN